MKSPVTEITEPDTDQVPGAQPALETCRLESLIPVEDML